MIDQRRNRVLVGLVYEAIHRHDPPYEKAVLFKNLDTIGRTRRKAWAPVTVYLRDVIPEKGGQPGPKVCAVLLPRIRLPCGLREEFWGPGMEATRYARANAEQTQEEYQSEAPGAAPGAPVCLPFSHPSRKNPARPVEHQTPFKEPGPAIKDFPEGLLSHSVLNWTQEVKGRLREYILDKIVSIKL